tara:strand:- start:33 stop:674 length:642 start_codon:yes stop_codon:yes gene_type:complete
MVSKKIIIIFFFFHLVYSQELNLDKDFEKPFISPVLKSLILPGWGEYSLGYKQRGRIMVLSESVIFFSILGSYFYANKFEQNYKAYASEHANVATVGKNRQYWVDIGNYSSIDQFNEEHLRWRDFNAIYEKDNNWNWLWDNDENRKYFEKMRIRGDTWKLRGSFLIGGMVLNHIISAIDALYLSRISSIDKAELNPIYYPHTNQYKLILNVNF